MATPRLSDHQARLRHRREHCHDHELIEVIDELLTIVGELLERPEPSPNPVVAIRLHINRTGETMPVQLTDTEKVTYGYTEEDARGNVVPNTGAVTWSVGDPSVLALTDNGDGTATVAAAGPLGSSTVDLTIVVTHDDGSSETFQGSDAVNVVAGDVSQVILNAGTPEAQ